MSINQNPSYQSFISEINLLDSNNAPSFLSNNIISNNDSISLDSNSFNRFKENLQKTIKLSTYSVSNHHFICKNCKKIPQINFISFKIMDYSCSCFKADKISIDKVRVENIMKFRKKGEKEKKEDKVDEEGDFLNIESENYFKCQKHEGNFIYYCRTCEENICRQCLRERYFHQYHNIFFFDLYLYDMDYAIGEIDKILLTDLKDLKFEFNEIDDFIYLLSVMYNDYLNHPNYFHFLNFFNAYNFLHKYLSNKDNIKNIENFELKKEIKIIKKKQLYENIKNPEIIIEIDIPKSFFNDITDICNLNFINLKILKLIDNSIINIQPLKRAKFKKTIEIISFQQNKINDKNIPCLLELDFPNLKELDLYSNNITDPNLFKLKNNEKYLPSLESLQVGANIIDWKINKNNDIKYNLDSVKSFGLTNGLFDNNTIFVLQHFNLNHLEKIDISRNNIKSLSFIEKLDAANLKEFYIHSCFITEFYPLKKYTNLQKIYIYDNYISKIDKLEDFVDNLKELIEIDLSGNNIDTNDEKNQKILKSVQKKKENLNIILINYNF